MKFGVQRGETAMTGFHTSWPRSFSNSSWSPSSNTSSLYQNNVFSWVIIPCQEFARQFQKFTREEETSQPEKFPILTDGQGNNDLSTWSPKVRSPPVKLRLTALCFASFKLPSVSITSTLPTVLVTKHQHCERGTALINRSALMQQQRQFYFPLEGLERRPWASGIPSDDASEICSWLILLTKCPTACSSLIKHPWQISFALPFPVQMQDHRGVWGFGHLQHNRVRILKVVGLHTTISQEAIPRRMNACWNREAHNNRAKFVGIPAEVSENIASFAKKLEQKR